MLIITNTVVIIPLQYHEDILLFITLRLKKRYTYNIFKRKRAVKRRKRHYHTVLRTAPDVFSEKKKCQKMEKALFSAASNQSVNDDYTL